MFLFPRNEYIGRSMQKRKPLREVENKPILDKYNSIIDRFLLCSKQNLKKSKFERFSSSNGPISLNKPAISRQNNLFYPLSVKKNLSTLNIDDFKILSCKKRNTSNIEFGIRQHSITPTFEKTSKSSIPTRSRAKSVNARRGSKITKILQTDNHIIAENDSQEEDSPIKFCPLYDKI